MPLRPHVFSSFYTVSHSIWPCSLHMPPQYSFARPLTTHALTLPRPPHPPIQPPRAFSEARLGKQYKAPSTCKAAWLPSYQHHQHLTTRCGFAAASPSQQLHSSRSRAAAVEVSAAAAAEGKQPARGHSRSCSRSCSRRRIISPLKEYAYRKGQCEARCAGQFMGRNALSYLVKPPRW